MNLNPFKPNRFHLKVLRVASTCVLLTIPAAAQSQKQTGFYSEDQATRGKTEFTESCAGCHTMSRAEGDEFFKNPPSGSTFVKLPLAGGTELQKWRTAGDLFSKIRRTMPANKENSLPDATYLDIVAYMLQSNGLPAGKPLTADVNGLHQILLDSKLQNRKSVMDDVSTGRFYTEEQAQRGKAYFQGNCMTCHTTNPDGKPTAFEAATGRKGSMFGGGYRIWPIGPASLFGGGVNRWQNVFNIYNKIHQSMPGHDPGGLSPDTYVDLAAYMLKVYGLPAGDTELQLNVNSMKSMTLNEPGFTKLFNGRDFTGIKFYLGAQCLGESCGDTQPSGAFKVEDGTIIDTGTPEGYWYYDKKYLDFTLRFEFRVFPIAGLDTENEVLTNSGYLLFINQHAVWPKCIEIQGQNLAVGTAFGVGTELKVTTDAEARLRARKPVGQWNAMEIVSKAGKIVVSLNGTVVSTVTEHEFKEPGYIGFQAEGGQLQWRNIRIKEE